MAYPKHIQVGGFELTVRPIAVGDLEQVKEFCDKLNWHISLEELKCHLDLCPKGFLGAFRPDGRLMCNIIAMSTDGNLGYIGLFVTAEEHRGKGIGRIVLGEAIKLLKGRNILLDAVPNRRDFYMRYGFNTSQQVTAIITGKIHAIEGYKFPSDIEIQEVTASSFGKIHPYDIQISTIDRSDHLPTFIFSSNSKVLGAYQNGKCVGFCAVRDKGEGIYKLEPLYSDTPVIATALMQSLVTGGLIPMGSSVRMYPLLQNKRTTESVVSQFGIESAELGLDYRLHLKYEKTFAWQKIFSTLNSMSTVI